jgi:putative acetyltransferase
LTSECGAAYLACVQIRAETDADHAAIHAVNAAAFPTAAEADLVDALRQQARPLISLVAEQDGVIVGHILFSPVTLDSQPDLRIMGLAPMAVAPEHQRSGIGSALVRAGLEQCRQLGYQAVVVLGHPEYYPRFGFVPSVRFHRVPWTASRGRLGITRRLPACKRSSTWCGSATPGGDQEGSADCGHLLGPNRADEMMKSLLIHGLNLIQVDDRDVLQPLVNS